MGRSVYADNAATTAVSAEVLEAMLPFYKEVYGNPSSLYSLGRDAKTALEEARARTAGCLGANANEIYFTSCGSESDNWAVKGAARAQRKKGKNHIITSAFEHHAVLHTCQALEKEGFEVTYLNVHENGIVHPDELEAAITDKTALVTIMYANNEIGTIQPIPEIGAICKKHGVLFHTDAVQAIGNVHINVKEQNIDMLSLSGHKIHAPKGVGALYLRSGVSIENFMDGGAQERGRRAGTENVAEIVGLSVAMERACSTVDQRIARLTPMRDKLIHEILKIDRSRLNGDPVSYTHLQNLLGGFHRGGHIPPEQEIRGGYRQNGQTGYRHLHRKGNFIVPVGDQRHDQHGRRHQIKQGGNRPDPPAPQSPHLSSLLSLKPCAAAPAGTPSLQSRTGQTGLPQNLFLTPP